MAGNTAGQKPELTELAAKYKHPTGKFHKVIAHTGKSGLTPVPELRPDAPVPFAEVKNQDKIKLYQKARSRGFTMQLLVDMEAFAPLYKSWLNEGYEEGGGIDFMSLQTPIHGIFVRENWERPLWDHLGRFPLGNGRRGYWEGQNEVVWKALEPCLRLASLFLANSHTSRWWDTLLFGRYEEVMDGIPNEFKGQLLRLKPNLDRATLDYDQHQKQFQELLKHYQIEYHLISGWTNASTGLPNNPRRGSWKHATTKEPLSPISNRIEVYISYELLEPLLRSDLTAAERKIDIFRFTVTLLHECCHSFWIATQEDFKKDYKEPYFGEECLSELGFSMEHAVLGGTPIALSDLPTQGLGSGLGISSGAIYWSSFFTRDSEDYKNLPVLLPVPEDWDYKDFFPIPIGYFEGLYRPEFWIHVRKYGAEAAHMGPKVHGSRCRIDPQTRRPLKDQWTLEPDGIIKDGVTISDSMSEDEKRAAEVENLRRRRAERIHTALHQSADDRRKAADSLKARDGLHNEQTVESEAPSSETPGHGPSTARDDDDATTEYSEDVPPSCRRFWTIRRYLLKHRNQGQLCLDTMNFDMPEHTLFHYINRYGDDSDHESLPLTFDEWREFLKECASSDRELLTYNNSSGIGLIRWLASPLSPSPSPPPPLPPHNLNNPNNNTLPSPSAISDFRTACLVSDWTLTHFPDFDIDFLRLRVNYELWRADHPRWRPVNRKRRPWEGGMSRSLVWHLVDWHDREGGDLWRWGPNGLARRRLDTWPQGGK